MRYKQEQISTAFVLLKTTELPDKVIQTLGYPSAPMLYHWRKKKAEKVVRHIIKQEKLIIRRKHRQKYNSYKGKITPAVENVIDRDFHVTKPNQK